MPFDVDLSDPSVLEDPYPTYARLRNEAPVYFDERLNVWVLSRNDDIVSALKNFDVFSSARMDKLVERRMPGAPKASTEPFLGIMRLWQQMVDPPKHTRLRTVVNKGFTPRRMENLRASIEATVDRALDRIADLQVVDFVRDFALPVSAATPLQLYGVPLSDLEMLDQWTQDMTVFIGGSLDPRRGLKEANESIVAMRDYFREMVRKKRVDGSDDLIGRLVQEESRFQSEDELCAQLTMIQAASYFTTLDMLGNGLFALLRNRSALSCIESGKVTWAVALEEILRFDGPVQLTHRLTTQDVHLRGEDIPAGSIVYLLRGSANRDPLRFERPDELLLDRGDSQHIALGSGVHYCTGAGLARLEGEIAFGKLFRRFPRIELATGVVWRRDNLQFRGLARLPLVLEGS